MTESLGRRKRKSTENAPVRRTKIKKKRVKKLHIFLGLLALISFVIWFGLQPLKASTKYGICRTYLETYMKYPTTLKTTEYDEFGASLRIFYTYTDPYGGQRSEMIECISDPNDTLSYVMNDIKIDRKSIGFKKLELFNKAISGILISEPDLRVPRPPKDNFNDLKRD